MEVLGLLGFQFWSYGFTAEDSDAHEVFRLRDWGLGLQGAEGVWLTVGIEVFLLSG